jgi:hypothetical protein
MTTRVFLPRPTRAEVAGGLHFAPRAVAARARSVRWDVDVLGVREHLITARAAPLGISPPLLSRVLASRAFTALSPVALATMNRGAPESQAIVLDVAQLLDE